MCLYNAGLSLAIVFPLALMWALPFWMSPVTSNLCTPLKTLKDELNATLRRRFLVK